MEAPKIEGITPDMLWTTLVVIVGLAALFVLGVKVYDGVKKLRKDRRESRQLEGQDITDRIAAKVMEQLTPKLDEKFAEIDRKLAADKETLELHTGQLNATNARVDRLDSDNKALLHGMSALLSHEVNGNSIDRLQRTNAAMNNYLIDRVYKEEDWA